MRLSYYLFLFVSTSIFSQNIQGILYDSEGIVPSFEIRNKTQQLIEKTDERGYFTIEAETGDSIIFNSISYEKFILVVGPKDFEEPIVLELKIIINNLNEVNLFSFNKEFNPRKYTKELGILIEKDKSENDFHYTKLNPRGNIYQLFGIIYKKIFRKKPSGKMVVRLTYEDFQNLFETDSLINDQFLNDELRIPIELKNLYYDYLDSLSWNADLLLEENKMTLMQKLYDSSSEYLVSLHSNEILK